MTQVRNGINRGGRYFATLLQVLTSSASAWVSAARVETLNVRRTLVPCKSYPGYWGPAKVALDTTPPQRFMRFEIL